MDTVLLHAQAAQGGKISEALQSIQQLLIRAQEQYPATREMARALGMDQSTISRKLSTYAIQK